MTGLSRRQAVAILIHSFDGFGDKSPYRVPKANTVQVLQHETVRRKTSYIFQMFSILLPDYYFNGHSMQIKCFRNRTG